MGCGIPSGIGPTVTVCHFPPGTSKWNKIEHRLFSFITKNRRGRPLATHQVIINLIGAATTRSGPEVYARLDEREYPKGLKVSDAELAAVNLIGDEFHPDWNYTIIPRVKPKFSPWMKPDPAADAGSGFLLAV